jgi:hypothetical protein
MAIMILSESHLIEAENQMGDIMEFLLHIPPETMKADDLIKQAAKIKIKKQDIDKLRLNITQIESESSSAGSSMELLTMKAVASSSSSSKNVFDALFKKGTATHGDEPQSAPIKTLSDEITFPTMRSGSFSNSMQTNYRKSSFSRKS